MGMILKGQVTKNKQVGPHNLNRFCKTKEIITKIKAKIHEIVKITQNIHLISSYLPKSIKNPNNSVANKRKACNFLIKSIFIYFSIFLFAPEIFFFFIKDGGQRR
jgi:hypothetical protein